jgi:hypothetical protein
VDEMDSIAPVLAQWQGQIGRLQEQLHDGFTLITVLEKHGARFPNPASVKAALEEWLGENLLFKLAEY